MCSWGASSLVGEIGFLTDHKGSGRQEGDRHWMVRLCSWGPSDKGRPPDHLVSVLGWPEIKNGVLLSDLRQPPPPIGADGLLS